ncbi:MAG: hypothetical protein M3443_09025 [Actinomycetota bacterium]|nr:hypothetical protein [Actinomycetota bacterium]
MTDRLGLPPPVVVTRLQAAGWTFASAGRPGAYALNSGHYFADGDGVSVLLRMTGDDALVSDGGVMKQRLADAQVDLTGDKAKSAWDGILRDFGLHEADDRVVGRKPASAIVSLLTDVVDAMLTLDGLKVLAKQPQQSRLERQLYTFLDDSAKLKYERHPTVRMPRGAAVRPTALVHGPNRDVYVQTTSTREGIEHAAFVAGVLKRAAVDMNQRLVVLKGSRGDWQADYVDLVADAALVGFMNSPYELTRLLTDARPA